MANDRLRKIAFERKHVRDIPIVMLRPKMMIGSSVNQLSGDANSFSFALDRSLEHMCHAKLLRDVTHISLCAAIH